MKVLLFNGSTRTNGCTYLALSEISKTLEQEGIDTEILSIGSQPVWDCIGCNACTKSCTQELNVMQYIAYAQRGDFAACAEESFDCVMCGVCSARCPAGISHPQVAMLARRINGKYLMPRSQHLEDRVGEIADGTFRELMESLMGKPLEELQELYNHRDIEK